MMTSKYFHTWGSFHDNYTEVGSFKSVKFVFSIKLKFQSIKEITNGKFNCKKKNHRWTIKEILNSRPISYQLNLKTAVQNVNICKPTSDKFTG